MYIYIYNEQLDAASLNVRVMKRLGKREEIEKWIKEKNMKILALQETHIAEDTCEIRDEYSWYFSGQRTIAPTPQGDTFAGVRWIIDNKYKKYCKDIKPISDRPTTITLAGRGIDLVIISYYAPTVTNTEQDKDQFWEELEKEYNKVKRWATVIMVGDANARIKCAMGRTESKYIGKHTFNPHDPGLALTALTQYNRDAPTSFCETHDMILSNTFKKQDKYLATHGNRNKTNR